QLGGVARAERAPAGDVGDAPERGLVHAVAAAGHRQAEAEHGHVAALATEGDGVHAHAVVARQLRGLDRIELAGVADAIGEQDEYALAGRLRAQALDRQADRVADRGFAPGQADHAVA